MTQQGWARSSMSLGSFDACSSRAKRDFIVLHFWPGDFPPDGHLRSQPEKSDRSIPNHDDESGKPLSGDLKWAISWCRYSPVSFGPHPAEKQGVGLGSAVIYA